METPIMIVLTISGLSAQIAILKLQPIRRRIEEKVGWKDVREHVRIIIDKPP